MKKPMFDQMADDIAAAIEEVVQRYMPSIKKRKCSRRIVGYWISEGAQRMIRIRR